VVDASGNVVQLEQRVSEFAVNARAKRQEKLNLVTQQVLGDEDAMAKSQFFDERIEEKPSNVRHPNPSSARAHTFRMAMLAFGRVFVPPRDANGLVCVCVCVRARALMALPAHQQKRRRGLQVHEAGHFIDRADRLRAMQKLEKLQSEIASAAKKTGTAARSGFLWEER
jgi:hypothetical protein